MHAVEILASTPPMWFMPSIVDCVHLVQERKDDGVLRETQVEAFSHRSAAGKIFMEVLQQAHAYVRQQFADTGQIGPTAQDGPAGADREDVRAGASPDPAQDLADTAFYGFPLDPVVVQDAAESRREDVVGATAPDREHIGDRR